MAGEDGRHSVARGGEFDLDGLLESVQKFQQDVAGSTQRMAQEVADAWSEDRLVHVWVNAQGVVIDVDVDESEFASTDAETIAAAMLQAAQAAASTMQGKVAAFQATLRQQLAGLAPAGTTDLVDIEALQSVQPTIPTSRPGTPERRTTTWTSNAPDDDADGWDLTLRG